VLSQGNGGIIDRADSEDATPRVRLDGLASLDAHFQVRAEESLRPLPTLVSSFHAARRQPPADRVRRVHS
jgi:hypothetical protein